MSNPVLSPATMQVCSYLAHRKQPPAEIADPECRPSSHDAPRCSHVEAFLDRHKDGEGIYAAAFSVLRHVGREKRLCAKAIGPFEGPMASYTKFKTKSIGGTTLSIPWPGHLPVPEHHAILKKEFWLKERLDGIGNYFNRSIPDTGIYTVLKFLNDLEAEALDVIVERDAPELKDQVKKFNANTKFTYKSLRVDPDRPPIYSDNRKPRALTIADYPIVMHTCSGTSGSGFASHYAYLPDYGKPL